MSENELVAKVRAALGDMKLDLPELKTKEGVKALSENLDAIKTGYDFDKDHIYGDFDASAMLIRWMNKVPRAVLVEAVESLPAIFDRIRKAYMVQGHDFTGLDGVWTCRENLDRQEYKLAESSYYAWKTPYDPVVMARLKEIGYDYLWYEPYANVTDHPEKLWIELIKLYPCESFGSTFVFQAIRAEFRDLLTAMKETDFLPQEALREVFSQLKGEQLEFFRSIWCEKGEVPEIALAEGLLAEEAPSERALDYSIQLAMKANKLRGIVLGAMDAFDKNRLLLLRAVTAVPVIALFNREWASDPDLFTAMMSGAERYYAEGRCSGVWDEVFWRLEKEYKDNLKVGFKKLYPTDESKRSVLAQYPHTAIIGFYGVCSKNIKEDIVFWAGLYRATKHDIFAKAPLPLKKNQEFLRLCCLFRPIDIMEFNKYFVCDSQEALEFALQHTTVNIEIVPKELLTRENIYRLMENNAWNIDKVDYALFSDEEFVVGAAAYDIHKYMFFRQVDKKLRKMEHISKLWNS